jgi:predicted P-loop ATPase
MLGAALVRAINEQFGDAVKIDAACFRNEQPCYTPIGDVKPVFFTGEPLPVDAWLQNAPRESESTRARGDGKISSGQRNTHLSNFAFALRKKGISIEGIEAALHAENRAQCDPPLGEAEVRDIARGKERIDPDDSVQSGLRLKRNRFGQPLPTLENVVTVLTQHEYWRGNIYFDQFHGRIYANESDGSPREWSDKDDIGTALWLQSNIGMNRVSVRTVADAVLHVANLDRRDEVVACLKSLQWDGEPRLPMLLLRGFGAPQNDYHAQVGSNFLIGMAARALQPGCKLDAMPVLEGAQGTFKSTGLSILGGKWFAEVHQSIDSKDFHLALKGKLLLEISEMHSFGKAEVERLKGVMSCQVDRYRAPYERRAADHPRRCVFAGTTNRDDWNRDETGARRFWPVVCGQIDLDWLTGHRDQLLAEAVSKFKKGATWWEVPREHAEREQDARRVEDPWQPAIAEWLIGRTETTTHEIFRHCLLLRFDQMGKQEEMRVGAILKHLGWKKGFRGASRNRGRCWVRGE